MKIVKLISGGLLAVTLAANTGCNNNPHRVNVVTGQPIPITPISNANNGNNNGQPLPIGAVKTALITLKVRSADNSKVSRAVTKAVTGAVVKGGFKVADYEQPYAEIVVGNSGLERFDKMGNYYVYKAGCDYSLRRTDAKVLAQDKFEVKGGRKLGEVQAKDDAIRQLSNKVATDVVDMCKNDIANLKMVVIDLQMAIFKKAFGNNTQKVQRRLNQVLLRLAKYDGVVMCNLISNDWNTVKIRLVYKEGSFPNGIVYEYLDSKFSVKYSSDPVGSFIRKVFKI